MSKPSTKALVAQLRQMMIARADRKTKNWFEAYMKGSLPFLGLKVPPTREVVKAFCGPLGAHPDMPLSTLRELGFSLIREPEGDVKLAGILVLQEHVLPKGGLDPERDLPRFAALFDRGHIADWSTCDWLCVRVLGRLVQQNGKPCAQAIAAWREADNLWRARASAVAFVHLAKDGDANFRGFSTMVLRSCQALVERDHRFAHTGAGWVMRELGRAEPERLLKWVEQNLGLLTREGLRYALEKQPKSVLNEWVRKQKELRGR